MFCGVPFVAKDKNGGVMMRKKISYLVLASVLIAIVSCAHSNKEKKPGIVKVPAGSNIPSMGLALDASYDSSLDNLVPGYKILTTAITNNSINILQLNPAEDEWILVDGRGSTHKAVKNLRTEDNATYVKLSAKLRTLLEYPLIIQVSETKNVDLLFKDSVKIDGFRSVKFVSSTFRQTFEITAQD